MFQLVIDVPGVKKLLSGHVWQVVAIWIEV